jgi:hypothetical protein
VPQDFNYLVFQIVRSTDILVKKIFLIMKAGKHPMKENYSSTFTKPYGFDAYNPLFPSLINKYNLVTINGKEYRVPWKAVPASGTDNVYVNLSPFKNNPLVKTLQVTDANSNVLALQTGGNDSIKQVLVTGQSEGKLEVTATYAESDTSKQRYNAGKLNVVVYDNGSSAHNVVLVPVNNNVITSSPQQIQDTLNRIYGQACETFTVSSYNGPSITYGYQTFDANPPDAANYSTAMDSLVETFKNTSGSGYDANTFYLFLLNHCAAPVKNAIMPFNQNFGFIFTDNPGASVERTIAHELGHGEFGLLHTFRTYGNEPQLDSAKTDNLMDYADGTHLFKYQWDEIHEPVCYTETCFGTGTTGEDVAMVGSGTFHPNETEGYNYIYNHAISEDNEYGALITEKGLIVSKYKVRDGEMWDGNEHKIIGGKYYVKFNSQTYEVVGHIHIHQNAEIDYWSYTDCETGCDLKAIKKEKGLLFYLMTVTGKLLIAVSPDGNKIQGPPENQIHMKDLLNGNFKPSLYRFKQ